jgi:hypothetical protein
VGPGRAGPRACERGGWADRCAVATVATVVVRAREGGRELGRRGRRERFGGGRTVAKAGGVRERICAIDDFELRDGAVRVCHPDRADVVSNALYVVKGAPRFRDRHPLRRGSRMKRWSVSRGRGEGAGAGGGSSDHGEEGVDPGARQRGPPRKRSLAKRLARTWV